MPLFPVSFHTDSRMVKFENLRLYYLFYSYCLSSPFDCSCIWLVSTSYRYSRVCLKCLSGQFHQANTHSHCLWLIKRWRLTEWELVLDSQTLGYNRSRAAMHRWPTPPLHRVCCEVREVRRRKWTVLDAMMEDDQPKLKPPTPSPLLDLEHSPGASSVTNHAEV